MDAAGTALARVQYAGHLELDRQYAPLAEAVAALVLRLAAGGLIPPAARFAFRRDLERLLAEAEPALARIVAQTAADAATAVYRLDGIERAAPTDLAVLSAALAGLHRNRANVLAQADALLQRGALRGLPAAEVAEMVSDYADPWFSARRDATGTIRRAKRVGSVERWPGQSGMMSAYPRTLMLTEATAAHANATLGIARERGLMVRYRLSHKHAEADRCTQDARRDIGYGRGVYPSWPLDAAPRVPQHPRCRCWYETFEQNEVSA